MLINMNKIIALLIGFLLIGSACEDELDKTPIIGELESNFYKTEADAIAATNAAYGPLQYNFTNSVYHFRWFFGNFPSDDAIKGGTGPNDQPLLDDMSNFKAAPSSIYLNADWTAKFMGVYSANVAIEKIPTITMDETLQARLIAEAKFLRAYYYFELVTMYGGVPVVDHVLASTEFNMPRATEEATWDFIEMNLLESIPTLPEKSQYAAEDMGRATKGAAKALLVKSYIYQEKWAEALTVAEEVIASAEYTLLADYETIFLKEGENGPGSIFEIQRSTQGGGYWGAVNRVNEGNLTNVYQMPRGSYGGWGFNIPTQDFVDAFEAGDPRLQSTVWFIGDQLCDRGILTKNNTGFDYDYYSKKYFVCRSEHEAVNVGDPQMNGESNDRIIRYADLLLFAAEAAYHTSDEVSARAYLEMVRARARRTAAAGSLPEVTATGTALLDAIYHERRVELGQEGHRFFDIARTGRGTQILGAQGFTAGVNELFPIPQEQISLTGNAYTQNPGY